MISQLRKLSEGRGTGILGNYKPWIFGADFNSQGTCSGYPDPIHGRAVQVLSQGELRAYLKIRFNDKVFDIREQYPLLNVGKAYQIARDYGIQYPTDNEGKVIMTTDLLVVKTNGKKIAYSCKPNVKNLTERDKEKLFIEGRYWIDSGIEWKLIETDKISKRLATNIRNAFEYYNLEAVHDCASEAKHLVATRQINVDMEQKINWVRLGKELGL